MWQLATWAQEAPPASFNWTTLGLSGVFLLGLMFVTKKYFELVTRIEARAVADAERAERLAVVLDRVQTGMTSVLNLFQGSSSPRAPMDHPTPIEMLDAFRKLEEIQRRLDRELKRDEA
jgi:hypothetical protein